MTEPCPRCSGTGVDLVVGYQCYICNRKFARHGEAPTRWTEIICTMVTGKPCPMEASFCQPIGKTRSRAATLPPSDA